MVRQTEELFVAVPLAGILGGVAGYLLKTLLNALKR